MYLFILHNEVRNVGYRGLISKLAFGLGLEIKPLQFFNILL